jgi:hypothetical protein
MALSKSLTRSSAVPPVRPRVIAISRSRRPMTARAWLRGYSRSCGGVPHLPPRRTGTWPQPRADLGVLERVGIIVGLITLALIPREPHAHRDESQSSRPDERCAATNAKSAARLDCRGHGKVRQPMPRSCDSPGCWKVRRYPAGVVPTIRRKWCRRLPAAASPTLMAMASTGRFVCSSSSWAALMR